MAGKSREEVLEHRARLIRELQESKARYYAGKKALQAIDDINVSRRASDAVGSISRAVDGPGGFAIGLMAASYLLQSFMSNTPLSVDRRPTHNVAPGADGVYEPAPVPPQMQMEHTVRVHGRGEGYEGLQIKISAQDLRRMDPGELNALVSKAVEQSVPVQVSVSTTVSDNTSEFDRRWIESQVASAIRGY